MAAEHADRDQPHESQDADVPVTVDDRFRGLGRYFLRTIESLRDTHSGLSKSAQQLDDLASTIRIPARLLRTADPAELKSLDDVMDSIPEDGISTREFIDRLWDATENFTWGPEVVAVFSEALTRRRREPLFHGAMLTSFVSSLEAHFSNLAREYFHAAPEALHDLPRDGAKEFSLRDIQAMSSIEDAVDAAIDARVSDLAFGNLAGWRGFFKDKMKIDLAELCLQWEEIQEIFERRNCVVHHDGLASKRYVRAIGTPTTVGTPLTVSDAYAQRAVTAIELLGIQLHVAVWRKFSANPVELIDWLEATSFGILRSERWDTSLALYETWRGLPLTGEEKLMAHVNLLLAKKGIDGLDAARPEIEAWDVSGLDEMYAFAKVCLLEDLDRAFALVPDLVAREKLGGWALATWPLTKVLRADPRIQAYADEMKDYLSETAGDPGDADDPDDLIGPTTPSSNTQP